MDYKNSIVEIKINIFKVAIKPFISSCGRNSIMSGCCLKMAACEDDNASFSVLSNPKKISQNFDSVFR